MSNIIIAIPELSDNASVIAVGSEADGFPADNLQTQNMSERWRTAVLASVTNIDMDLGSTQIFNFVALTGTNASASALVRIRGAVSNASSALESGSNIITNGNPIASTGSWTYGSDWEFGHLFDAQATTISNGDYLYAVESLYVSTLGREVLLIGGSQSPGNLYTSTDGVVWSKSSVATANNIEGFVGNSSSTVIACTYDGELIRTFNPTGGPSQWEVVASTGGVEIFRSGAYNINSGVWAFPSYNNSKVYYGAVVSSLSSTGTITGFTGIYGIDSNGGDKFVAVGGIGNSAVFYASSDASTWASTAADTSNGLLDVVFGGGVWVACGYNGAVVKSSDGTTWASVTVPTDHNLYCLEYDSSQAVWMAAGASGVVFESVDEASTWSQVTNTLTSESVIATAYSSTYGHTVMVTSSSVVLRNFAGNGFYRSAGASSVSNVTQTVDTDVGVGYTSIFKISNVNRSGVRVGVGGSFGSTVTTSEQQSQIITGSTGGGVVIQPASTATGLFVYSITVANASGAESYDSGWVTHWPEASLSALSETPMLHYSSVPASVRYVRVQIADVNNADGYYEAARLFISNAWEPVKNISYGWGVAWEDKSVQNETSNGNTIVTPRNKYRVINFNLDFNDEDEMYNNAYIIDRYVGMSKDVIVVRDINSSSHTQKQSVHGYMTELNPIVNSYHNIFKKRYKIKESI